MAEAGQERGLQTAVRNENIHSPLLPGGSLFAAANERQLMGWSDRGGASRYMGDCWASRVAAEFERAPGQRWPLPGRGEHTVLTVVRLDESEALQREVNRYQLENPDFVLVGQRSNGSHVLQSVDAKFAVDRIKRSQVSAETLTALYEVENGVARGLIQQAMADIGVPAESATPVDGLFVAPRSTFTDLLVRRLRGGRQGAGAMAPPIVTIEPDPGTLYVGTPPARLIGPLARIDMLPVTPRENLLSAIYYLRLACACLWLSSEEHRPLFGGTPPFAVEPTMVAAEITARGQRGVASAWELVLQWATDIEPLTRAREAIHGVATLPIPMRDIRTRVEAIAGENANRVVRATRRDLDVVFRERLTAEVGEISADDPRPLGELLDMLAQTSRGLRPAMLEEFERLLLAHTTNRPDDGSVA